MILFYLIIVIIIIIYTNVSILQNQLIKSYIK